MSILRWIGTLFQLFDVNFEALDEIGESEAGDDLLQPCRVSDNVLAGVDPIGPRPGERQPFFLQDATYPLNGCINLE